jgi:putative transposase
MKQPGLKSKRRRKFKATTQAHPTRPAAPNGLNPAFETTRPDRVYVGDITFIPTEEGGLYLAVLIDLYSRAVVGWAMSARINTQLTHDALMMALWKRRPAPGLIVHSDRGSQ